MKNDALLEWYDGGDRAEWIDQLVTLFRAQLRDVEAEERWRLGVMEQPIERWAAAVCMTAALRTRRRVREVIPRGEDADLAVAVCAAVWMLDYIAEYGGRVSDDEK